MQVVDNVQDLRDYRAKLNGKVGLVPTMGYLHAGHLALVKAAREACEAVIATIFVNPTQFAQHEDLSTYPRDLPRDLQMLEDAGVDLVFTPTPDLMYPPRFQTYVTVEHVSQGREGGQRPAHFKGVATVVAKLFNLCQPDVAFFGQKDAQQIVVIRQLIRDLNFPVETIICPIVRESDGLALSSRNVYLEPEERKSATSLYRALQTVGQLYEQGERAPNTLRDAARHVLQSDGVDSVDYISLADAITLEEIIEPTEKPILLSLAAQVGRPRLLDNCLLPLELNTQDGVTKSLGMQS